MDRSKPYLFVFFGSFACLTSGCITFNPGAAVSGRSQKQNIQNASFQETVEEAPKTPENLNALKLSYARLMEDVGRHSEAKASYEYVSVEDPENVEAILGSARLNLMSGEYQTAEAGFKKAIKLNPQSSEANHGLGQYYASQSQWDLAIEPMTKAMLNEPNNSQYRYSLAVALTNTGDIDSAIPHFIRTVGDAEAHYNVAVILKEKGELNTAEQHLVMALTKKPEFKDARSTLLEIRNRQEKVVQVQDEKSVSAHIVPTGHLMKPGATVNLSPSQQQQLQNQSSIAEQL